MQIPDEIRKCVGFVRYKTNSGMKSVGTAFFISMPLGDTDSHAIYVVTAKHVIDVVKNKGIDNYVYLRINLKQGSAEDVATPIDDWMLHPTENNVDVCTLAWAPDQDVFDYRFIPQLMAATEDVIKNVEIGIGDDVFLTGLFVNHYGTQKNIPIIRVGNIASMPEEKVHTKDLGDIDAYLIEVRSMGGLSGSPVFVYLAPMRRNDNNMQLGHKGPLFYWLGLMHGHFDLAGLELDNPTEDTLYDLKINMGIAVVVPVWKILEVINQETYIKSREKILNKLKEETSPTVDNLDETFTKETFEDDLKKVSRRIKSVEPGQEQS